MSIVDHFLSISDGIFKISSVSEIFLTKMLEFLHSSMAYKCMSQKYTSVTPRIERDHVSSVAFG